MTPTWYSLIAGAMSFLDFAIMVAFLVVSVTVVRTRRPDAFLPFAIASALFMFDIVLRVLLGFVVSAFMARTSSGDVYTGLAAENALAFLLNALAWICVLIGLVKIANTPAGAPPLHLPPGGY